MPNLKTVTNSLRKVTLGGLFVSGIAFPLLIGAAGLGPQDRTITREPGIGEKLVEVEPQTRDDAVMITAVKVDGSMVPCGLVLVPNEVQTVAPFRADSDWLQTMTISFFNRTNRTIVAAFLTFGFPETGDGRVRPQHAYHMDVGRVPAVDAFTGKGQPMRIDPNRKPLAWEPGQTFTIRVGDFIKELKAEMEGDLPVAAISRVSIHIGPFFFQDGMRWFAGVFEAPDRGHPGKYRAMPDDYFPGNQLLNWPPGYRY